MNEEADRITGLAYDPADPQFLSDPADYYRWLREEEPVHLHEASGSFLLSRFQDVWEATADWQTFSSESPVAKFEHMASMDPPGHDGLRSSVVRWFTPSRIARAEPLVRATCRELLGSLGTRTKLEFVAEFASVFPSRVIHRLLGVPSDLDESLRTAALAIGAARDSTILEQTMERFVSLTRAVLDADPPPHERGLIQQLQSESGSERLSDDRIRGVCSNLVLAGTDTVTNLLGNGLVLLQRHPEARERLVRDPASIPAAIEEMLRFESPVQSLARRAVGDVTMHGVPIPAGSEIRLMWGAANRDDREFERADHFLAGRSIRRHLGLGHGIHFCLGAGLARLEARVAFEEILALWPSHEIDETKLERLPSLWVRAWERVFLEIG